MVTVFTPAYNRAYTLERLYQSLCQQTSSDFEWLIIDDGSTDETEQLVQRFVREERIPIVYSKVENGGKHRAINRGVQMARGELFFIVDSDDWLMSDAIEVINRRFSEIASNNDFCGVCGLRCYPDGTRIGGECDFGVLDCTAIDFRFRHRVKGDMAEVIKTDILKKYPFPEIENEKFCPEALVWNRLAMKYKFRYFYTKIYVCEYLPDGLTAGIVRVRRNSPVASMMYYSELYRLKIDLKTTVKAAINFWRFAQKPRRGSYRMWGLLSLASLPLGKLMRLNDSRKI